jgi:hypothetical protein
LQGFPARTAFFVIHTVAVYACALYISPWLVGRWFTWAVPILHISVTTKHLDWYLQHLEIVTIVPALIVGYVGYASTGFVSPAAAVWVWTVPALVLIYRMLQFDAPHSVLIGSSMSAFRYYFDIMKVMPTRDNFLVTNPARVLAQEFVTAPFYAGTAYSLGAWLRSFTRNPD